MGHGCRPGLGTAQAWRRGHRIGLRSTTLLVAIGIAALTAVPASASAETFEQVCTNTWNGPSGGSWGISADWSAKHVPTSSDVACIEGGKVVKIEAGTSAGPGVIQGEGTVAIESGSLEVANALESSKIASLIQFKGTISGPGTLEVYSSLVVERGAMSGSGSTVILSKASAALGSLGLKERLLLNEGTATLHEAGGTFQEQSGAEFKNMGTAFASELLRGESGTSVVNTGRFENAASEPLPIEQLTFENLGTLSGVSAPIRFMSGAVVSFGSGMVEGTVELASSTATGGSVKASSATLIVEREVLSSVGSTLTVTGAATAAIGTLDVEGGIHRSTASVTAGSIAEIANLELAGTAELSGSGTVTVSKLLDATNLGTMSGPGVTRLLPGATATMTSMFLSGRTFINEGTAAFHGTTSMTEEAHFQNLGKAEVNGSFTSAGSPTIVNKGSFEKTEHPEVTIEPTFENSGQIVEVGLPFVFLHPVLNKGSETSLGPENPSANGPPPPHCGEPVSCATGNFYETETDLSVGGRGVGLDLTRTYNAQAAAAKVHGPFGYGWSSSFSDHVVLESGEHRATLVQAEGSTVPFAEGTGEAFTAPAWTQDTLSGSSGTGYTVTLADQTKYHFSGTGRLENVTDRNGNQTTLSYSEGRLTTITDPASRKITLHYNSEGLVGEAEDPMGHSVKYTYDKEGNLASVTQPGEASRRWQFKYDSEHQMTELTDGRGGKTVNKYNGAHQVERQTDPAGRTLEFEYGAFHTRITNESTKSVTNEDFTSAEQLSGITHGFGTTSATTEAFSYDSADDLLSSTDGDGHTTNYTYKGADRTSMTDPDKDVTKWEYNSTHDVVSTTTPKGETTTIERDSHGNAKSVSRPAPESETQTTEYTYGTHGELESVTDPLKRVWKYGYDSEGDRISETDPEGDKRTWSYNEDSQEIATTSPRGNAIGAEAAKYTTTIERDAQGRPLTLTEPLGESLIGANTFTHLEPREIAFGEPTAVAVGASGTIWVADSAHDHVLEFNSKREFVEQLGSEGKEEGQFKGIGGIATDSAGDLYVVDSGGDRVEEFSSSGTFKGTFGSSTGPGQLKAPCAIAIDESGNIWVLNADFGSPENGRVVEFSSTGHEPKEVFGTKGTSAGDMGLAEGIAVSGGHLYLAEFSPQRVQEFSKTGEYIGEFDEGASGKGTPEDPTGIGTDPSTGDLFVTEIGNRVQQFSASGSLIATFGSTGSGSGEFSEPKGVAVNSSGTVYVADAKNERLQEWKGGEPPTFANAFTHHETVDVQFGEPTAVAVGASGTIWVADSAHDHVLEFNSKREFVEQLGSEGKEEGQFKGIGGIATDSAGDLYVVDSGGDRVEEFSSSGTFKGTFGSSTGPGQLKAPCAIAIDESGNIWVLNADFGSPENGRVVEFSSTGHEPKEVFGTKGTSAGDMGLAEGIAVSGGHLYLAEFSPQRVQEFSKTGEYIGEFDEGASGKGTPEDPTGIGTDPSTGDLFVTEIGNRVQQFSASGSLIATFGSTGSGSGEFSEPKGVAVNSSGTVYVADAKNERLQEWKVPSRITQYTYDANGNLETQTDPNGHKTTYAYGGDNEPKTVTEPNGTVTETEYNGEGQVVGQIDGNKNKTTYVRNAVGEVIEVIDPLKRTTVKEYDKAGNLEHLIDAAGRTTTYIYDPANRLKEVTYSDKVTPTVKYEYDADGDRKTMTDGTGTTTYTYDQLDRLVASEDGHKDTTAYKYDLANEQTAITYPNGKAVTRKYDNAGRLKSVKDWKENTTTFVYDPDSDLTATEFPTGTNNVDDYAYNNADQMSAVKMTKGSETLASLTYARDGDGQVVSALSKGLPGEEDTPYEYDEDSRLTNAGTAAYEYDAANNPTKTSASINSYNAADELEAGTGVKYKYDELGERTNRTPASGSATVYGYDEAGNLTSVARLEEGSIPAIEDSYAYNGEGLRASQTIAGTTTYLTWDRTESLPLILSDGNDSFIYGPGALPIEQISSAGSVLYLHHDQQGSTRLLTGPTGSAEATDTYDAYGNVTGRTGTATSPLGFDGQYTNSDTGLIYLRARSYDPATAQFISADPIAGLSLAPYDYAEDNPPNAADPSGLCSFIPFSSGNCYSETAKGASEGVSDVAGAVGKGADAVGSFAEEHPIITGVALGAVAVATGGGALLVEGTAGAALLGSVSVASGLGAAAIDGTRCLRGDGADCVGAGLGVAGLALSGPSVLAADGVISELDAYGPLARAGLGVGAAGTLWDGLNGLPGGDVDLFAGDLGRWVSGDALLC